MKIIKKRIKSIFVIFILWLLLILIFLFYFTVYSRHKYIKNSNSLSFREGIIPARRGTIFDKNGEKLAWNMRYYDLYLKKNIISNKRKKLLVQKINEIFPTIEKTTESHLDNKIIIKRNLNPKELKSIQTLLSTTPELIIIPTLKRTKINISKVKIYIGIAQYINDTWVGLSGIEKKHNSYLNGTNGLYTVVLDKDGMWIKGTGINKKKMIPGKNLFLKKSINDIIKQNN